MKKIKYYAIKDKDKSEKIIFTNWDEAKIYIQENKIKAYKSFLTREEAIYYLEDKDIYQENIQKDLQNYPLIAFSDGSYSKDRSIFSYGVVLISFSNIIECNNYIEDPQYIEYKNVSGEIFGIISVLNYALKNNIKKVLINYDYLGIENWANGKWECNNILTKNYNQFFKNYIKNIIEVDFRKIKSHSNNKYNDKADILAKKALLKDIIKIKTQSEYIIIFKNNYYNINEIYNYIKDKEYPNIYYNLINNEKIYIQTNQINNNFIEILIYLSNILNQDDFKILLKTIYNYKEETNFNSNQEQLKYVLNKKYKNINLEF